MGRWKIERPDFKFNRETGTSGLQAYCLSELKKYAPHIKAFKATKANEQGVSDLIICVKGKYIAVELKAGNNTPSEHQKHFIDEIIDAGGIAGVAYTWGEVKSIIRQAGFDIDDFKKKE